MTEFEVVRFDDGYHARPKSTKTWRVAGGGGEKTANDAIRLWAHQVSWPMVYKGKEVKELKVDPATVERAFLNRPHSGRMIQ